MVTIHGKEHGLAWVFVAGIGLSGCRAQPANTSRTLPLGPAAEIRLGVPGAMNDALSIAARESFVAIGWTARTASGADIYLSTSGDGGASFSEPRRVNAPGDQVVLEPESAPHVVFEWPNVDAHNEPVMPDIRVEWMSRIGGANVPGAARSADGGGTFVSDPKDRVRLFYAGPPDDQRTISNSIMAALSDRAVAHTQSVLDPDGTLVVGWDEPSTGRVALRRFVPGRLGKSQSMPVTVLSDGTPGVRPVIASIPAGVIVAWTSGQPGATVIAVRRVGLDTICATPVRAEAATGPVLEYEPWPAHGRDAGHHD